MHLKSVLPARGRTCSSVSCLPSEPRRRSHCENVSPFSPSCAWSQLSASKTRPSVTFLRRPLEWLKWLESFKAY